jgi:hypothetical protein
MNCCFGRNQLRSKARHGDKTSHNMTTRLFQGETCAGLIRLLTEGTGGHAFSESGEKFWGHVLRLLKNKV